jgi:hypothetical protein
VEPDVQMITVAADVLNDRVLASGVAPKQLVQPFFVLTDLEGVGVEVALDVAVDEDPVDVGLGYEGADEGPRPGDVQVPPAGPEEVLDL